MNTPSTTRQLGRDECLSLLATTKLGRIALSDHALPTILPVVYRVTGDAVEFEASGRLLMTAAQRAHVVCFEADAADFTNGTGWSVLITGRLELRAADLVAADQPWLPRGRGTTLRLPATVISGRSVTRTGLISPPITAGLPDDQQLAVIQASSRPNRSPAPVPGRSTGELRCDTIA